MPVERQAYEYWLNSVPGIGIKGIRRLLEVFGTAEEVYRAKEGILAEWMRPKQLEALVGLRRAWDLRGEYEKLGEAGIHFVTVDSDCYPGRLKEIPDPPYGLFFKGKTVEDDILSVAVVGARECSEYGRYVARTLGKTFAENGVQLVSGMARGIDGISEEAALDGGGKSFAVLGCGVDVCYPAQNRPLYDSLVKRGGVLSAYPPGTQPKPNLFPPRNRIVSGLSDALIVVEARQQSGTLITVDMALEQGREVYVVPGRLTDRLSDGCNRLLKQGAGIVLSPDSFLEEMKLLFPGKKFAGSAAGGTAGAAGDAAGFAKRTAGTTGGTDGAANDTAKTGKKEQIRRSGILEDPETKIFSCLDYNPRSVEEIGEMLDGRYEYQEILKILMKLCLFGKASQAGAGFFQKRIP